MKKQLLAWHNKLVWFGLATLVCWALSGISHPMMAWFGPQPAQHFPPRFQAAPSQVLMIDDIIRRHNLGDAHVAKLVPTAQGAMLQVTDSDTGPRRYFSLESGNEIDGYDVQQAQWLAVHYSGLPMSAVSHVERITEFSAAYPWVNRLLPVYKVSIGTEDDVVSVYVYTETNALASLSNDFKSSLQLFFQALHTWNWLDISGIGRVLIVALLMLSLLAMAITGLLMVFALPRRRIADGKRRWHRWLGYALWLPLLGWSASGFYHLLQAEYVKPVAGVRLASHIDLQQWLRGTQHSGQWSVNFHDSVPATTQFNAVSLVANSDGQRLYRLGVAPSREAVSRNARFAGKPGEAGVIYLDSATGKGADHNDRAQVLALLTAWSESHQGANSMAFDTAQVSNMTAVTRFGPGYDFRNKRLPVWQVDLSDAQSRRVFVDPASGVLVDQNRAIDRLESLSFSLLHKWNHLVPVTGRSWRDGLIVATLLLCLASAATGLLLYIQRRKRRRAGSEIETAAAL